MNDFNQSFNPTNYTQLAAGGIFYVLLLIATIFSLITITVLIKRSNNRAVAFGISVVYLMIFFSLAAQGISTLNTIK